MRRRSTFLLICAVAQASEDASVAAEASCLSRSDSSCGPSDQLGGTPPTWSLPEFQLPGFVRAATSQRRLVIGASPGTTATMSLYYALKMLDVSTVHYSRQFNASTGRESTSYAHGGGPVPLLKPLFRDSQPAPPVDLAAVRQLDLRFLGERTEALLDTPAQEIFFDLLATFPRARVVLTLRDPVAWAESRRQRHPTDRAPVLPLFGVEAPMGALSTEQAATALALWHKVVAASVPPERLLVLDVFRTPSTELWRRLCAFMQKPLPSDEAGQLPLFPHLGYGDDMRPESTA